MIKLRGLNTAVSKLWILLVLVVALAFPMSASAAKTTTTTSKTTKQTETETETETESESETETEKQTETEKPKPYLSATSLSLIQYQSASLSLKNANNSVYWRSSNDNIATVDSNGKVKTINAGSCQIIARFENKDYICTVSVAPLQLNMTSMRLLERRPGLQLKVNNPDAANGAYWYSDDTSVAKVDSKGNVKAISGGNTSVHVVWNNITLTCTVNVMEVNVANLRKFRSPKRSYNRGKVVLAGTTIFDFWRHAQNAFGYTKIINNGYHGSTIKNWNKWYKKLIVEYKPKVVVFCVGNDDIGKGKKITAKQNATETIKLLRKIKKALPSTNIIYLSLPRYPDNPGAWNVISASNLLMKKYCAKTKRVYYVSSAQALLDSSGKPKSKQFVSGHSYLSSSGYKSLKNILVKKVRKLR